MANEDTTMDGPLLVLFPSLRAQRNGNGELTVTRKFLDGVQLYQSLWPGNVKVVMETSSAPDSNLDHIPITSAQGIDICTEDYDQADNVLAELPKNSVVLCGIHYRQNNIPLLCKKLDIPCIQTSEYTLKTRLQIAKASKKNPLKRWRTYLWEYLQEKKNLEAIKESTGLQTNGLPTYNAYNPVSADTLLYFDTRVTDKQLITYDALKKRTSSLLSGRPLNLLFSGRLNAMKGADHLIKFADCLKGMGCNFVLTICGDGDLRHELESNIKKLDLQDYVRLAGVLDFNNELIPFAQENADLFICCHRQGDPSCTYLETMSCGVPIAGYANEAWKGLHDLTKIGWIAPMNDYQTLARVVADLDKERKSIVKHSLQALEFAQSHTFDKTFANRIQHLRSFIPLKTPAAESTNHV